MPSSLELELLDAGARLVPHADNKAATWWGKVAKLGGVQDFARHFWITIGRDICYPTTVADPYEHVVAVRHEIVHVRQQAATWLPWWLTKYLASQEFRWQMEREAYLVNVRAGWSPTLIAHNLRRAYKITAPSEAKMVLWFEANR